MAIAKTSKKWVGWPKLTPKEAWMFFIRVILIPFAQSLLIFILNESIRDKVQLFFIIWLVSFAFVMFGYSLIKFEPLRGGKFKKEIGTKLIYITFCSLIYTLSFVAILTVFIYGRDIPMISYNPDTYILSIYLTKVGIFIFMWFSTWLISTAVARFIIKT
jgi:Zn-dependent protease with chaperone function